MMFCESSMCGSKICHLYKHWFYFHWLLLSKSENKMDISVCDTYICMDVNLNECILYVYIIELILRELLNYY